MYVHDISCYHHPYSHAYTQWGVIFGNLFLDLEGNAANDWLSIGKVNDKF